MSAEKSFDVLVAGELNLDMILDRLHRLPELGKEVLADRITLTLGSSSAIFAANLASLGNRVAFCGRVGSDGFAEQVLRELAAKKVDCRYVAMSATADTGITVAFNFQQERAMVTYPGAMNELEAGHITDEMLAGARHLHVSSVFLQPGLKPGLVSLFRRAKALGLSTSLDPQWDPAEAWDCPWNELLPLVDIFLPNTTELQCLTGKPSREAAVAAVRPITRTLVVKDGTEGSLVLNGDRSVVQAAFLHDAFVDAIGAGDSFNAGFIHAHLKGRSLEDCAASGALVAAISTMGAGGTTAFGDLEAVQKTAFEKFNRTLA